MTYIGFRSVVAPLCLFILWRIEPHVVLSSPDDVYVGTNVLFICFPLIVVLFGLQTAISKIESITFR